MAEAVEDPIGVLKTFDTHRARLAFAFAILIVSGAAGLWYVLGFSGIVGLILYTSGLLIACFALWPVSALLDAGASPKHLSCKPGSQDEVRSAVQCEIAQPVKTVRRRVKPKQSAFDFDGMKALRARDSIDGAWLVAEASLQVIEAVRAACRTAAPEHGRLERWFEIVLALNTARHAKDEKAEVRRTQIAKTHGVSEEQTRQIDQGRYGPLNRMIAKIDPSAL